MKLLFCIIMLTVVSNVCYASEKLSFKYPKKISCTPKVEIEATIEAGIQKVKDSRRVHIFEHIANGKYRFPLTKENNIPVIFNSGISHQGDVINIFSNTVVYSIAMYRGDYLMSSTLPDFELMGVHATLIQGDCVIEW